MNEKNVKAVRTGKKRVNKGYTDDVTPSKEQLIAEAFYKSGSFAVFIQKMRIIHGTDYMMSIDDHKAGIRAFRDSGIKDPSILIEAHELLLKKELYVSARVRQFIALLFNEGNLVNLRFQ